MLCRPGSSRSTPITPQNGAIGTLIVFIVVFILVPPILLKWDTPRWPRRATV